MSALSPLSPVAVSNQGYVPDVARGLRNLVMTLFALRPAQKSAAGKLANPSPTVSLKRLYRLSGAYDSVMPNLAQELAMAARRAE